MARTNKREGLRWLGAAPLTPEFGLPRTLTAWEKKRAKVREQLWQLLGRLPARPKIPRVQIVSRTDHGDYVLEKFQFDNGAGATVTGYLLLPSTSGRDRRWPAILYCH